MPSSSSPNNNFTMTKDISGSYLNTIPSSTYIFTITATMIECTEGIKSLLGKHVKILLTAPVKLETKNDKFDNRVLVNIIYHRSIIINAITMICHLPKSQSLCNTQVFCPCRLFCLKIPPRVSQFCNHICLCTVSDLQRKNVNCELIIA